MDQPQTKWCLKCAIVIETNICVKGISPPKKGNGLLNLYAKLQTKDIIVRLEFDKNHVVVLLDLVYCTTYRFGLKHIMPQPQHHKEMHDYVEL